MATVVENITAVIAKALKAELDKRHAGNFAGQGTDPGLSVARAVIDALETRPERVVWVDDAPNLVRGMSELEQAIADAYRDSGCGSFIEAKQLAQIKAKIGLELIARYGA